MTSKEVKQLIGKPIKYHKKWSSYLCWREATVLGVQGKNVLIDRGGMTDWLWLPDVCIVPLPEVGE